VLKTLFVPTMTEVSHVIALQVTPVTVFLNVLMLMNAILVMTTATMMLHAPILLADLLVNVMTVTAVTEYHAMILTNVKMDPTVVMTMLLARTTEETTHVHATLDTLEMDSFAWTMTNAIPARMNVQFTPHVVTLTVHTLVPVTSDIKTVQTTDSNVSITTSAQKILITVTNMAAVQILLVVSNVLVTSDFPVMVLSVLIIMNATILLVTRTAHAKTVSAHLHVLVMTDSKVTDLIAQM
jgi:hypothetical protein